MENNNVGSRKMPAFMLGENSNITDNSKEELEAIKDLIPQEGTPSVEDGFQKMMAILNKQVPVAGEVATQAQQQIPTEPSPFDKVETKKPKKVKKAATPKPVQTPEAPAVEEPKKDTPVKTRSEELGLHYTDEEILPLFDSIMTKGYASETLNMRGHSLVFRTTFGWEDQEIITRIDKKVREGLNLRTSTSYFYDLYSLAATLEQFGANYFEPIMRGTEEERKESLEERIAFLEGLGSPIITILANKRMEFLKKIQFLLDNYDRLLKAF